MPARPSRSGSSTATSSPSPSRSCRWRPWARSSAIAASIWRGWRFSPWRRSSAACRIPCLLLTAARIVQGFGAAGIMSVNAALVRFTYPRTQLGHGIGLIALVVAVSAAVGPTLAAAILSVGTWPFLFAVNIPFGIAALHRRPPRLAAHAAGAASLRLAGRHLERAHLRPRHRRHRQRRAWRGAVSLPVGIHRRGHRLRDPGAPRAPRHLAVAAGRSAAHSHFRAFDLHLGGVLLRPDAGLRGAAFLSPGPFRLFGGPDRPPDHALADRGGMRGAHRRPAGGAPSGGAPGRHRASGLRGRAGAAGAACRRIPRSSTSSGAWRCRASVSACSSRPTTAP